MKSLNGPALSSLNASPVMASVPSGSDPDSPATSSAWSIPLAPATVIQSNVPGSANSSWASAVDSNAAGAPAKLSISPNVAIPDTVNWRVPEAMSTPSESPTEMLASVAVRLSSTSVPGVGAVPATRSQLLSSGTSDQFSPKVGGPALGLPMGSPAVSMSRMGRRT